MAKRTDADRALVWRPGDGFSRDPGLDNLCLHETALSPRRIMQSWRCGRKERAGWRGRVFGDALQGSAEEKRPQTLLKHELLGASRFGVFLAGKPKSYKLCAFLFCLSLSLSICPGIDRNMPLMWQGGQGTIAGGGIGNCSAARQRLLVTAS